MTTSAVKMTTPSTTTVTRQKPSPDEVDERIRAIEIKYDLLQYQVENWCAWCVLRFPVQLAAAYDLGGNSGSWSRAERLKLTAKDLLGFSKLSNKKYLAKTYSSGLVEREGEYYKDVWFDDLLRELGSFVKVEAINNLNFAPLRKSCLIKSDLTTTLFDSLVPLLTRLGTPKCVADAAAQLSACLQREFGPGKFTYHWAEAYLKGFYWGKKVYSLLFKRVRPEYLLVADPGEHALVAAAKENGVKVIELQHGLINRGHSAYSWTRYALRYRDNMPIPDKMFLHGEHYKKVLDSDGFWQDALTVVGSPRMDWYRRRKNEKERDGVTILLTTQGIDVERVIAFVQEFLHKTAALHNLQLDIKLHPGYEPDASIYEAAFESGKRVRIMKGNELPTTYDLITQADWHLSISSSCHYDAIGLGVSTVILPFATHEIMADLYESGHGYLVQSAQDLADLVMNSGKSDTVAESTGSYYFKPGAIANMRRELGEPGDCAFSGLLSANNLA